MRTPRRLWWIGGTTGLVVLLAALVAAPAWAAPSRQADGPASDTGSGQVRIEQFAFAPSTVRVPVGATVTWTNLDAVAHTATSREGGWGSGLLGEGQQYSRVFAEEGVYEYFCQPHPWMRGAVVVGNPAEADGEQETSEDGAGWLQWMRQHMGPGHFDAMRQWMDATFGAGTFESMPCHQADAENGPPATTAAAGGQMGRGMMSGTMAGGPGRGGMMR